MSLQNPFEYIGANDLAPDTIVAYYIEDFNFSRFINSPRNVLLVGERGCGKSMTLLYHSLAVQRLRAEKDRKPTPMSTVGIYVPCNTPLMHKQEFELLDDFRASVLSEHYLVLILLYRIADTLAQIPDLVDSADSARIRSELGFILNCELPDADLMRALALFSQRECVNAQRAMNSRQSLNVFYENTFSFVSLIAPVVRLLRTIPALSRTHFAFLIDDAHDLNDYQRRALFSWIAYRDHTLFSFKVAIANVSRSPMITSSGGTILEGHDYTRIDMVAPLHNERADFGKLARLLIERRLRSCGIAARPEEFFPVSRAVAIKLAEAEEAVRKEAVAKYPDDSKKVSNYVYKYARARFFRDRPSTANRPEYSGFDTLVFLSTGVIRNLLMPCYWMYDKVLSLSAQNGDDPPAVPQKIPPKVQSEIILARSRKMWEWIRDELDKSVEGCSRDNARRAYQLLDNLAILFRARLMRHHSEPSANSFTISRHEDKAAMEGLYPVLDVLIAAQLLYVRSGPAKDRGRIESYYVPNRMLWPARGLDPHGQHARVSIPSVDLWAAAELNRPLPYVQADDNVDAGQRSLFDEQ